MQLNVLNELRQLMGSLTSLTIDEQAARLGDLELRDIHGALTLLRTDRGLLVSLDADASLRERCARCLADCDCGTAIQFEEEFIPVVDANTDARVRDAEADDAFRIDARFVLDLREAIREYLLMAEPLKPLCRPDCAGLCPSCGANLNDGACPCAPVVDERWGALAGIKLKNAKGS